MVNFVGLTERKFIISVSSKYRPATILSPRSISDISPTCGRAQGDINSDSDFVQISGSSFDECESESGLTQISITTPE